MRCPAPWCRKTGGARTSTDAIWAGSAVQLSASAGEQPVLACAGTDDAWHSACGPYDVDVLTDRNLGNVLITPEWQIRMIDYTRAFRLSSSIRDVEITRCDRRLLAALESLTLPSLKSATERYLRPSEMKAVLERRSRIVAHVRQLIADKGEAAVLY